MWPAVPCFLCCKSQNEECISEEPSLQATGHRNWDGLGELKFLTPPVKETMKHKFKKANLTGRCLAQHFTTTVLKSDRLVLQGNLVLLTELMA